MGSGQQAVKILTISSPNVVEGEPTNQATDCYFCFTKTIPIIAQLFEYREDMANEMEEPTSSQNRNNTGDYDLKEPYLISQSELNHLVRNLQLSQSKREFFAG